MLGSGFFQPVLHVVLIISTWRTSRELSCCEVGVNFALKMQSLVKVGIDSVKFEYSSRTVGVEFMQRLRRVFVKFARKVVVNKQEIIV